MPCTYYSRAAQPHALQAPDMRAAELAGTLNIFGNSVFSARCNNILARTLCRWTLQGLAYVELSGRVFDPPGCVAEGMPGASADDLRQVRPACLAWDNKA